MVIAFLASIISIARTFTYCLGYIVLASLYILCPRVNFPDAPGFLLVHEGILNFMTVTITIRASYLLIESLSLNKNCPVPMKAAKRRLQVMEPLGP